MTACVTRGVFQLSVDSRKFLKTHGFVLPRALDQPLALKVTTEVEPEPDIKILSAEETKYLQVSHQEWHADVQGLIVALAELGGSLNSPLRQAVTKKCGKVVSATLENKCAIHTHSGYSQA